MRIGQLSRQCGGLLLEALIAIVIFSFGILGLIGMQATAIKQSADAKLRSDASYLASQIISQMWVDRSHIDDYIYQESGSPSSTTCTFSGTADTGNVTLWLGDATSYDTVKGALPAANAQIKVVTSNLTKMVTVTICWQAPQDTNMHNFTSTALISG